jgi:hypothetical protein
MLDLGEKVTEIATALGLLEKEFKTGLDRAAERSPHVRLIAERLLRDGGLSVADLQSLRMALRGMGYAEHTREGVELEFL